MTESVKQRLVQADFGGPTEREMQSLLAAVQADLTRLADRQQSAVLKSPTLAVGATGALVPKFTTAGYAVIGGKPVHISAHSLTTAQIASAGTIPTGNVGVVGVFSNSAGSVTCSLGTVGTSVATAQFPATPTGKAALGYFIITPAASHHFVAGTNKFDGVSAAAVPLNPLGAFDPTTTLNTTA